MKPTVVPQGPLTRLTGEVAVPSQFAARFQRGGATITLELVVERGRVECRSVSVTRAKGRVTLGDLRLRLATEMIPAAIEAACQTVVATFTEYGEHDGTPAEFDEQIHGAVTQFARIEADSTRYRRTAQGVGRPKLMATKADLRSLVAFYEASGGSLALTAAEFHVSTATVHRRLQEARQLGLLKSGGKR